MKFQGPILARVPRRRAEDRREVRLPTVWVRDGREPLLPETTVLRWDAGDLAAPVIAGDTVIVMLSGDCASASSTLLAAARAGKRVYVLAAPGWGAGALASVPRGRVLVRHVEGLPATALWSAADAFVWTSGTSGGASWRLTLTAPQAHALRLAMLRLFWHHGLAEAWNDEGALVFQACAERPFDVPEATSEVPIQLVARGAASPALAGDTVYLPGFAPRPHVAVRAWLPPSGNNHAGLAALRAAGVEVVWHDLDLPACGLAGDAGELRAASPQWTLSVALDAAQRDDLREILATEAPWRFLTNASLGDIDRSPDVVVWLPGSNAAASLRALETLDAGETPADSLRGCATTEPVALPAPSPLSLRVEWQWGVRPPSAPATSSDDPLVQAWRRFDASFRARVELARRAVDGATTRAEGLGRSFESLRAAVLGFNRAGVDLGDRLVPLGALTPSAVGPDVASSALAELRAIEGEVAELQRGLNAEEARAREARDREEQRDAFEQKQADDRATLDAHEQELEAKSAALAEKEKILAEIEASPSPGLKEKDRKASLKSYGDDLRRLKPRVDRLRELIEEGKRKLEESFVYRPNAVVGGAPAGGRAAGAAFVPAAGTSDDLRAPMDPLPSVGRLVVAGKQRYLGIRNWEDLDVAEREAVRLSARLVAEVAAP